MSSPSARRGPVLVLDAATSQAVVALAAAAGEGRDVAGAGPAPAVLRWPARGRQAEGLLVRIDDLLGHAGVGLRELDAIGVGTGPGSFTGLRVGLATAKGLAYALGRPLIGIRTSTALLAAARAAGAIDPIELLLPAGPADRVRIRTDEAGREAPPERLVGEADRSVAGPALAVAVDLRGREPEAACDRGDAALDGLGRALALLAAARLAAGSVDDPAELVPIYAGPPRGVGGEDGPVAVLRG